MHDVQALLDGGDVSNKWRRGWGAKKNGNRHCKWLDGNAVYRFLTFLEILVEIRSVSEANRGMDPKTLDAKDKKVIVIGGQISQL